jgi:hypothetical protein
VTRIAFTTILSSLETYELGDWAEPGGGVEDAGTRLLRCVFEHFSNILTRFILNTDSRGNAPELFEDFLFPQFKSALRIGFSLQPHLEYGVAEWGGPTMHAHPFTIAIETHRECARFSEPTLRRYPYAGPH